MQDIKHYTFQFPELNIKAGKIEPLLGYGKEECPETFHSMISEMLATAEKYCSIEGGYVVYHGGAIDIPSLSLTVNNVCFYPGKIILVQLRKSEAFVFFNCTAGKGIEEWSKMLAANNDPLGAYISSVIGSVIVEMAMDKIQSLLKEEMERNNLGITNRYSPGYCGWSTGEQKQLFSMFPDNFCNIRLTGSMMMDPVKSVSGIIGVGKDVKYNPYICNLCNRENCIYKKPNYFTDQ